MSAPLIQPRAGSYVDVATRVLVEAPRGTLPPPNARPLSFVLFCDGGNPSTEMPPPGVAVTPGIDAAIASRLPAWSGATRPFTPFDTCAAAPTESPKLPASRDGRCRRAWTWTAASCWMDGDLGAGDRHARVGRHAAVNDVTMNLICRRLLGGGGGRRGGQQEHRRSYDSWHQRTIKRVRY